MCINLLEIPKIKEGYLSHVHMSIYPENLASPAIISEVYKAPIGMWGRKGRVGDTLGE